MDLFSEAVEERLQVLKKKYGKIVDAICVTANKEPLSSRVNMKATFTIQSQIQIDCCILEDARFDTATLVLNRLVHDMVREIQKMLNYDDTFTIYRGSRIVTDDTMQAGLIKMHPRTFATFMRESELR